MKHLLLCCALLLPFAPAMAQAKPDFHQRSATTAATAAAYFAAYVARDWDRIEPMLGDAARFEDPTASTLFGSTTQEGKPAMMKAFRNAYSGITAMSFTARTEPWASGEHAVFSGELDWTIRLDDGLIVRTRMPLVVRLRVRDGQVVEHIDTADYRPFVTALREARAQRARAGAASH